MGESEGSLDIGERRDHSKLMRVEDATDKQESVKKKNHSEIEKRRRGKMNSYITELSSLIPACSTSTKNLDKIAILTMAVDHFKSLQGSVKRSIQEPPKPSFLTDEELKRLISQVNDGFLFVVSCDKGLILFVSKSVTEVLNFACSELLGESWFNFIHPNDLAKVKDQFSSQDVFLNEKTVQSGSSSANSQNSFSTGTRRSFFCRMKTKLLIKNASLEKSHSSDWQYRMLHCIGYIKSRATRLVLPPEKTDDKASNLSYFIAVGRVYKRNCCFSKPNIDVNLRSMEFISRYSLDGKFLFVDQQVTFLLGYLPQELLGTSCYDYIHHQDTSYFADCHRQVLRTDKQVQAQNYRFQMKNGLFQCFQSRLKAFYNPSTKEFQYIVSLNTYVHVSEAIVAGSSSDAFDPTSDIASNTNRIIPSSVSIGEIGKQIAKELVEKKADEIFDVPENSSNIHCINEALFSGYFEPVSQSSEEKRSDLNPNTEEKDETPMSIVRLLEADSGLNELLDFSSLLWPSP